MHSFHGTFLQLGGEERASSGRGGTSEEIGVWWRLFFKHILGTIHSVSGSFTRKCWVSNVIVYCFRMKQSRKRKSELLLSPHCPPQSIISEAKLVSPVKTVHMLEVSPPPAKKKKVTKESVLPLCEGQIGLPKSYMKRASEFHSLLGHSKDAVMRAAVSAHQFYRVLKSPTTKHVAGKVLRSHTKLNEVVESLSQSKKNDSAQLKLKLNRDLRNVIRLRTRRQYTRALAIKLKWKEMKISLRKVSRVTGTPMTSLRWYFTKPKGNPRKVTDSQIRYVLEFFSRSDVSMQLPHKRYANKYFLRTSFHEQYLHYVRHETGKGRVPLSKTSIHRILPKKVFKSCSKIPMQNCKCGTCENCILLLAACSAGGIKGVDKTLNVNALLSCCDNPKVDEYRKPIYSCGQAC